MSTATRATATCPVCAKVMRVDNLSRHIKTHPVSTPVHVSVLDIEVYNHCVEKWEEISFPHYEDDLKKNTYGLGVHISDCRARKLLNASGQPLPTVPDHRDKNKDSCPYCIALKWIELTNQIQKEKMENKNKKDPVQQAMKELQKAELERDLAEIQARIKGLES